MEQTEKIAGGTDLEHHAEQLTRTLDLLGSLENRINGSQIIPGETAFRDPRDTYHQITVGAVLVSRGINAHHARQLDGLLEMKLDGLFEYLQLMSELDKDAEDQDETLGAALLKLLDLDPGKLEKLGRYAEWRRAFERYMVPTENFLTRMTPEDFKKLGERPPSRKQLSLIRTTCQYHRIDFPEIANRLAAYCWLRDIGANPLYREAI